MKTVAVTLVAVALAALLPHAPAAPMNPHDNCANAIDAPKPCVRIEKPMGVPSPVNQYYYLWVAAYQCAPQFEKACVGTEESTGNPPLKRMGLLYEEQNRYPGLQRMKLVISPREIYAPDPIVLL